MKIGSPDVWPLNSRADRVGAGAQVAQLGAREEARRLQAIIDSGRDPRNVRNESIAADVAKRSLERQQDLKVAEAWAVYIEERMRIATAALFPMTNYPGLTASPDPLTGRPRRPTRRLGP
jgi:hypothetical protein